jgi:2-polyprenyl-3-methyl-5-hydroxy-6-metoxy-1,4-benzoquinol methylase
MGLFRFARNVFDRWRQVHTLRDYFAAQPLERRPCPLCGSSELRLLIRGDRDFLGIHTSQCVHCGFILSSPFYSPETVSDFYRERYRALFKGQPDPHDLAHRHAYLRERADFYAGFLQQQNVLPPTGGSLLDVGCGEGTLLRTLRERHPDKRFTGVEPTVRYAKHLVEDVGIRVVEDIEKLNPAEQFDTVLLIHVLEHVHDPLKLLKQIGQRVRPGGKVYVDVPDVSTHSSIIDLHLAHCNHFSVHTMTSALRCAGLHPVQVAAHRPPTLPPSIFAIAQCGTVPGDSGGGDPEAATYGHRVTAIDVSRITLWAKHLRDRLRQAQVRLPPASCC